MDRERENRQGGERDKINYRFVGGMGSLRKIPPLSQAGRVEACSYCVYHLYSVSSGTSVFTMSSPVCSITKR